MLFSLTRKVRLRGSHTLYNYSVSMTLVSCLFCGVFCLFFLVFLFVVVVVVVVVLLLFCFDFVCLLFLFFVVVFVFCFCFLFVFCCCCCFCCCCFGGAMAMPCILKHSSNLRDCLFQEFMWLLHVNDRFASYSKFQKFS